MTNTLRENSATGSTIEIIQMIPLPLIVMGPAAEVFVALNFGTVVPLRASQTARAQSPLTAIAGIEVTITSRALAPSASTARNSLPKVNTSARSKHVVLLKTVRKTSNAPMTNPRKSQRQ